MKGHFLSRGIILEAKRFYRFLCSKYSYVQYRQISKMIVKEHHKEFGQLPVRDEKIILSMTTIPSRFHALRRVIRSVKRQTMAPDKFIIYLDDTVGERQISSLEDAMSKVDVELRVRPGKLKPHKKYYFAMKEFPDNIIITIDDDIEYPEFLIETLYRAHKAHPDCVIASRCHRITYNAYGRINPYNDWVMCTNRFVDEPSDELLATGVGGILYPPHCMDEAYLFDMDLIQRLSLNADDIWLKMMQTLNGTKVVQPQEFTEKQQYLIQSAQDIALSSKNVTFDENDIYINNLMLYFNSDLVKS